MREKKPRPSSFSTMSKRGHGESQAHTKRKRKRNGVSTQSSILVPVDTPPPKTSKVMQVLHTNLEDPHTVRRSTVPISRGHQGQESNTKALGDDIGGDDFVAAAPAASRTTRPKRKRRNDSVSYDRDHWYTVATDFTINSIPQTKMETFVSFRPVIVDELIRRNGLQEHLTLPQCPSCLDELGTYRCADCSTSTLYCPSCILQKHESTPLHRLEVCSISQTILFRLSYLNSSGTEDSLSVQPSKTWATASSLVMGTPLARPQAPRLEPSLWSTTTGFTTSMSSFALARKVLNGLKTTAS